MGLVFNSGVSLGLELLVSDCLRYILVWNNLFILVKVDSNSSTRYARLIALFLLTFLFVVFRLDQGNLVLLLALAWFQICIDLYRLLVRCLYHLLSRLVSARR